jgi:energy-converting hydrogenase Eha subunit H
LTSVRIGWTVVGQVADVLQIAATIFAIVAIALATFGENPFGDPANTTLLVAAVTFAIVGTASIVTALIHSRQDDTAFTEGRRATIRTLYIFGVVMLVLALGTGMFLMLRPEVSVCSQMLSQ